MRTKRVIGVATSRLTPLMVALLVIPAYRAVSTPESFDAVILIITMQSLSLLLDRGIAQNAMKVFSSDKLCDDARSKLAHSIPELKRNYIFLGFISVFLISVFMPGLTFYDSVGCAIGFYYIAKFNVYASILVAELNQLESSFVAVVTQLGRHTIGLVILFINPESISTYIYGTLTYLIVCNWIFIGKRSNIKTNSADFGQNNTLTSNPIAIASIFGALAMQMDKVMLAIFGSFSGLGDYYLAQTIAYAPLLFLAAPISQYFNPLIFRNGHDNKRTANINRTVTVYCYAIFFLAVAPSILFLIYPKFFCDIWLGYGDHSDLIKYASVLMLGTLAGSFGYVPHSILIERGDYNFLAKNSIILSASVLALVYVFSSENILYLCYAYAAYHALSFYSLFLRCIYLGVFPIFFNSRIFAPLIFAQFAPIILLS